MRQIRAPRPVIIERLQLKQQTQPVHHLTVLVSTGNNTDHDGRHSTSSGVIVTICSREIFRAFQLVAALQVHPELRGSSKVLRKAQRSVCRDAPLAVHNLVDLTRRHSDRHGELVLSDPEALDEVLHQDLSRMDRGNLVRGGHRPLPPWSSIGPHEADRPLAIYADTMLPGPSTA